MKGTTIICIWTKKVFEMIDYPDNKLKVHIRDSNYFSDKYPIRLNPYIDWIWNRTLSNDNLTVFTDCHITEVEHSKSRIKVGWLIEPPNINPFIYNYVANNFKLFDLILVFIDSLLSLDSRFLFYDHGTAWVHDGQRSLYPKSKKVSAIFSSKNFAEGHKVRKEVVDRFRDSIDIMGWGYKPITDKVEGLKDYMYSISVENCRIASYYTEKIMDCFLTGSVPIYWGCPSIGKLFDISGIIVFNTMDELGAILKNIDEKDYTSRMPAIENNFSIAMNKLYAEKNISEAIISRFNS